MIIVNTSPVTRVNDLLELKNGDLHPIEQDVISPHIPGVPNDETRYQADFYRYYGLDIVTETLFNYPYPYTSEKTFRPITSKRPFIVVGAPGILACLKSKGFKTFSKIIDESYDEILDHSDRFDSVTESIRKFVTQPIEKIRQDVTSVIDVLEHNFQQYKILEDIEVEQITKLGDM